MTGSVQIAPAGDERWHALLSGRTQPVYRCLALRILMIRLKGDYARALPHPDAVVEELRAFFRENLRFAGDDYRNIFGGTGR